MIQVVPYDPAWPLLAASAIAELTAVLPLTEIEHIGSTAVPGLAAKPVIDLMAAVPALAAVSDRDETLVRLGYRRFDGFADRLFYARDTGGVRSHHLHVVTMDSWSTRNQRILRDHLLSHPEDAARYAELKQTLAVTAANGDAYTAAKTELIQELVDRARAERGLPREPVWEA
ncbi:GrpB family protein [Labedaea rhizosphaerae]|uniref:GrpB-like predicted nucleotidyltransferase (UPF0157 family) n=1 Tax=Labedaea rhizosphaerae TaxID=598644 RepID=A0A4R6RV68_LABRH|nr:GrpB family protein [Labedaea rhizosphaerae]TDP89986.1 GrpB-like predicted nucleotidyltransferase (UPF0157 family) [Labedaea rhizosphaerae]